MKRTTLKVGTRGSALALAQTQHVVAALQAHHPGLKAVFVPIKTSGDRIDSAQALRKAGKGVFVKEIERALLARKIDCAVHSLKDVPADLPAGLELAAFLPREEAADAFVGRGPTPIEKLPANGLIGTASLRRQALMRAVYRHLEFEELRGNLDTRLEKLRAPRSRYAGIVVAAAGLRRLYGEKAPAHQLLPKTVIVPAPGQGTLVVEIRAAGNDLRGLLAAVDHAPTRAAALAERSLLRRLEGGCLVPLGAYAEVGDDGLLKMTAAIADLDGTKLVRESATGTADDPEGVAAALETLLRSKGAEDILARLQPGRRAKTERRASRNGHRRSKPKARARAKSRSRHR